MNANSAIPMGLARRRANDMADGDWRGLIKGLLRFFAEEREEPEHAEPTDDDMDDPVRAAGVAVRAPDGALLLVRRKGADHAGEWAFPGGVREGDETPEATARRELAEETGYTPSTLEPAYATSIEGVDFATFLHQAPDKFEPKLNSEGAEHVWAMPDALPQPLHPGVAAALATDPPVSEAQRRAMFAAASGHSKLGIPKKVGKEFVGSAHDAMALDRASVRSYDKDGRLHVAQTNISKAAINPYRGDEIPKYKELGLDPNRIYNLLRHPDELKKGAATFNNLPLLSRHVPITAATHDPKLVIGSTGTDAAFDAPYLRNSLVVWPKEAIDAIESEEQKELSSAYRYRADMTPGVYDGQPYDGVMRDIVGSHVALVPEGRAGADVVVGDSALIYPTAATLTKELAMLKTKTALGLHIHGGLGAFVKVPWDKGGKEIVLALDSALAGACDGGKVTAASFRAGKPALKAAIAAIPKIAQDADLEKMHGFIDRLDDGKSSDAFEAGEVDPNKKASDETEEEKKKREEKEAADKRARDEWEASPEAKAARDAYDKRRAGDGKAKDEPPAFVGKPEMDAAMDAAVKKATEAGAAAATKVQQEIRTAEKFVRPWVGELVLAFDSAEAVHRKACEMLKIDVTGVHPSAFPKLIEIQPKPGAKQPQPKQAMDSAPPKDYAERFPGAARISVL
jgi:uncharacterized protein